MKKVIHSLVFKIVVGILIVCIPINIFSLSFGFYSINSAHRQVIQENENIMTLDLQQMDNQLTLINTRMITFLKDNEDYSTLSATKENTDKIAQMITSFQNNVSEILENFNILDGIFIYFPSRDLISVNTNSQNGNSDMASYVRSINMKNVNSYINNSGTVSVMKDSNYLYYCRAYGNGYYGFWINLNNLLQQWGFSNDNNKSYRFVSDADMVSNKNEFDGILPLLKQTDNKYIEKEGKVYIGIQSSLAGIHLISVINASAIRSDIPFVIQICVFIALLFLAMTPFIYFYFRKVVLRPVKNLVNGMKIIKDGNVSYRIPMHPSSTEFEILNSQFNEMLNNIEKLRIDGYKSQIKQQKVRLRYLSQQVQPHFILNTLNLIYNCEPKDYPLVQKLILCLVKYFRYIVNVNSEYISLDKEIEHIRNYYEIQKYRYPDRFSVKIDIDELGDLLIPPLSIQNFAENTIKYALKSDSHIDIMIHVKNLDGTIARITIADTGPGFSDDTLSKLHAFQSGEYNGKDLGIGIKNVIERFKLLYDNQSTIKFYNAKESGAIVEIDVPIHIEEGDN